MTKRRTLTQRPSFKRPKSLFLQGLLGKWPSQQAKIRLQFENDEGICELMGEKAWNEICWLFFFFFFFFRAVPLAYGSSQARGQIRAAAPGLHHSHSSTRSNLHLQPIPQPTVMLSRARDQTYTLRGTSWVPYH